MGSFVFKEFDQFVETLSGLQGRYILRTAQTRDWRLRVLDLNGVTMMMGAEGGGRVYNGVASEDCFHIFLTLGDGYGVTVDGTELDSRTVAWVAPGNSFLTCTTEPMRWLDVAVSIDLILRWAARHQDEFDLRLLEQNWQRRTSRSPAALVSLIRRLYRVDQQCPEQLHSPEAEHSARTEILDAAFGALLPLASGPNPRRRGTNHMKLLSNALGVLEARYEERVGADDLCVATGVSERTLRNLFHEYLGMSPHRYLMARRLHAIRAGIRQAAPDDTITSICARNGVWDFGRFSTQYRNYFGELPSRSLDGVRNMRSGPKAAAIWCDEERSL